MLKKIGSWIGSAKRYVANVQNEVSTLGENEIINDENANPQLMRNTRFIWIITLIFCYFTRL